MTCAICLSSFDLSPTLNSVTSVSHGRTALNEDIEITLARVAQDNNHPNAAWIQAGGYAELGTDASQYRPGSARLKFFQDCLRSLSGVC